MEYTAARGVILVVVFLAGASAVRAADPPSDAEVRKLREELEKVRKQTKELAGQIELLTKRLDGVKSDPKPPAKPELGAALNKLVQEVADQRDEAYTRIRRLETEVELLRDGHPFAKLKAGMAEAEVEKLIGKPEKVSEGEWSEGSKPIPFKTATYYVKRKGGQSGYLLTVEYHKVKDAWVYQDWAGPHIPNDR
jgi:cell division protein FtsB